MHVVRQRSLVLLSYAQPVYLCLAVLVLQTASILCCAVQEESERDYRRTHPAWSAPFADVLGLDEHDLMRPDDDKDKQVCSWPRP